MRIPAMALTTETYQRFLQLLTRRRSYTRVTKRWRTTLQLTIFSLAGFSICAEALPPALHYMVSPVSCHQHCNGSSGCSEGAVGELVNGAWVHRAGSYGGFTIICPVNISGDPNRKIDQLFLWYRDGNPGDPSREFVDARLYSRHRSFAGSTLITQLDSDTDGNGNEYGFAFVDHGNILFHPDFGRNYYVKSTIYRDRPSRHVAFTGIEIRFED